MSAMSAADWKRGTAAMLENLKRKGHNFRIEMYSGKYRLTQIALDGSHRRHLGPLLTKSRMFWFLSGVEALADKVAWDDAEVARATTSGLEVRMRNDPEPMTKLFDRSLDAHESKMSELRRNTPENRWR